MSGTPRRFTLPSGLRVVANPTLAPAEAEALATTLDRHVAERRRDAIERLDQGGHDGWLKGGPLRGESRWRHGLRTLLLRQPPPRVREFENLRVLPQLGLLAVDPLLAAHLSRHGLPRRQWLFTRHASGTRSLLDVDPEDRARAVVTAAADLGRLHAAGRRHGDAHPRNLLVDRDGRPVWIDLWRFPAERPRRLRDGARRRDLQDLLAGSSSAVAVAARARYAAHSAGPGPTASRSA